MDENDYKKRICVIGGGRWGSNHIKTLYKMGCLAGIAEADAARLEDLLKQYPAAKGFLHIEEVLKEDFDGFVLATPAPTHFSLGKMLLEQGRNILIEKPLALSVKQAQQLGEMAVRTGSRLMVGHVLLFHPAIIEIKKLIDSGKIGKLHYIYSNRLNFGTVRTEEDVLWSFAPHDISIINYFTGSEPEEINASGGCFLQKNIADVVTVNLRYPENIKAHIFASWIHPFKEHRMAITGSKGMLVFEDSAVQKQLLFYSKSISFEDGIPVKHEEPVETIEYERSEPLRNELGYFISHLDTSIDTADWKDGYKTVKVLENTSKYIRNA